MFAPGAVAIELRIATFAPKPTISRSTIAAIAIRVMIDWTRLPARTPRQLIAVKIASAATATNESLHRPLRQFEKITGKSHCDRRHPAGLNHEQQYPAVNKSDRWMQALPAGKRIVRPRPGNRAASSA